MSLTDETTGVVLAGTGMPSSESTALYGLALRRGSLAEDEAALAAESGLAPADVRSAVDQLTALHLLRREPGPGPPRLIPIAPEIASASLIRPIDDEVHRRQATITELRARLDAFQSHYTATTDAAPAPDASLIELRGAARLAGHLHRAAEGCTEGYVALLPNRLLSASETGVDLTGLVGGIESMRARGVRVRLLLQHAVRSDVRARKLFARLLMVFDADTAILLNTAEGGDGTAAETDSVVIRSCSAVRLLLGLVESTWSAAHPYAADRHGYQEVAGNLHHTIISLLAEGLTDEAVARRLGISVRTCRRHIAAVLRDLEAVSRFQAGVRVGAARRLAPPTGS